MSDTSQTATRQIARAAGVVMAAFVLSNLIGLVRQILVSNVFGTSFQLDAFNAASTYPDLIFSLVAGGALASAFVPTLTGLLTSGNRRDGWFLSSALINLVFVSLSMLSLISFFLAPQIVQYLLAPKYPPELQTLTTSILRILLIAPTIFGVSGLLMGILNAHQVFLWSALAPSMLWLGMIIGVLVLSPTLGIFGLAWGYVLGAAMHMLIQVPAVFRLPARKYFAAFGLRFQAVREVGRLMGPRVLGVAAVQINFVVNTILATGMAVGSLAALKYGWAIMTMPQVVIAQSIAIAALPTFSAQAAAGRISDMRSSLAATLRGVIFLSLPATVGLILLGKPLISLFFEHGAFTSDSTLLVSWALIWYTSGLIGHGGVEILSRAFYALHDTKTPVFISIAAMSLNVFFSLLFAYVFGVVGWLPFGGLALANSLATGLEMAALWILMRRRLNGLEGKIVLDGLIKSGLATIIMGFVLWAWVDVTQNQPSWLIALGGILLGGVTYLVLTAVLGTQEMKIVTTYLRRKFGRGQYQEL